MQAVTRGTLAGIRRADGWGRPRSVSCRTCFGAVPIVAGEVGAGVSIYASRLLEAALFGVKPSQPGALVAVFAGLTLIAFMACWVPARRASRVDPVEALRVE